MAVLQRTMGGEHRLMRVRIKSAVVAARLGKRSAAPMLVFAARVSSELLAAMDVLVEAVGKEAEADRRRLERFRERWRDIHDQVGGELLRLAGAEDLPKLEPGDWGALARWEAWRDAAADLVADGTVSFPGRVDEIMDHLVDAHVGALLGVADGARRSEKGRLLDTF